MELDLPKKEKKILKFWQESEVFQKSLKKRKKRPAFVFYDGPITVNAKPGIHHILSRIFKDLIPRYKTMRGNYVARKNGWDTHGLPVELEVEKKLGFSSKKDIEKYGIARFNRECKKNVQKYIPIFKNLTERIGYWVDMDNPYVTYDNRYIESLWWIIKQIWKRGLLEEDFKVVPWCPRCGTALSSHEVALGYKKIKENSIYVKFKIKSGQKLKGEDMGDNTYFLAWTTTPWTLPGNMALAVGKNIDYVKIENSKSKERYILAEDSYQSHLTVGEEKYKVIARFKGKDLMKLSYNSLFDIPYVEVKTQEDYIYRVISGDFVSTKEGTGIVHIAPAFGEDDLRVGKENKLDPLITVGEDGTMNPGVIGKGKFVKDADLIIVDDLTTRGLLFKEEIYEHDYPFCWRCHSPLLYYANPKKSWFIKVTKIKDKLIKNSKDITWVPSHIKKGRFGEWLKEVKDWAFSRERYWGTPLPVWKCENCENTEVMGSKEDLRKQKFSNNRYFVLRHALSLKNTKFIVNALPNEKYPLVKIGKFQAKRVAKRLKKLLDGQRLDVIFYSDLVRARQTAKIVAKELESTAKMKEDKELRDINYGEWEEKSLLKFKREFLNPADKLFFEAPKGGEDWLEVRKRMMKFIEKVEKDYKDKNILIVSHGDPLWLLYNAMEGLGNDDLLNILRTEGVHKDFFKKGELREMKFRKFAYNEKGELDLHRPYIDEVKFFCPKPKCEGEMRRVKEVCDVWFDSGAMPFAQHHYPMENEKLIDEGLQFPAKYIAEAIDQTRGWFYTLLTVSTLLKKSFPYENVICLGHVLDSKGEKMSKSKGNIVDPWKVIEKYGTDTIRWYFFTINQPGDSKRFNEKDVKKCFNRFILTLWNTFLFWQEYTPKNSLLTKSPSCKTVLDKWVFSQLNLLISEVVRVLDQYDIVSAARIIEKFVIEDLSRWYIHYSRPRFQRPKSSKELRQASSILRHVLLELSKLCAPFTPFIAEMIYREINKKGSVHLEDYPEVSEKLIDKRLKMDMIDVKSIISLGLQKRKESNIRLRQPLKRVEIKTPSTRLKDEELLGLIKEGLNVKEVIVERANKLDVNFDFKITKELKEEGITKEIIRTLQTMRKEGKLKKEEKIEIFYKGEKNLEKIIRNRETFIRKITIAHKIQNIKKPPYLLEKEVTFEGKKICLAIKKS